MERFVCRTEVISGENALSALGQLGCRRMLAVMPPRLLQGDRLTQVRLAAGQPETEVLEDTDPPATMKQAVEGSRKIAAFQPDLVVALGDGNTIDLGKAMVCFSKHPCILAAVPTAFTTGSEVTDSVSLFHQGRRHLLQDEAMRPKLAILQADLTRDLSGSRTAECGFELLASALESCTAPGTGMLGHLHSREAFAACWAALPGAAAGDPGARHRLQMASVLTGLAGCEQLGLCRAMENSLEAVLGISRGKAAAIVLPAVVGCNAHAAGRQYAQLSRAAGLGGSRADLGSRNLRSGLIRLRRELGLPGTLLQAGVDIRRIWNSGRRIVELTLEDASCRNNPVAVDDFLVRRLLEEITGQY